jgi:hypothetical protein
MSTCKKGDRQRFQDFFSQNYRMKTVPAPFSPPLAGYASGSAVNQAQNAEGDEQQPHCKKAGGPEVNDKMKACLGPTGVVGWKAQHEHEHGGHRQADLSEAGY